MNLFSPFRSIAAVALAVVFAYPASAQLWMEQLQDGSTNVHTVRQSFHDTWGNAPYERGKGYKVFKRWEWFWEQRTYPSGERPSPALHEAALQQLRAMTPLGSAKSASWTPLGPFDWQTTSYNPGAGRVNCIAQDPNNANTVYVGTASGGLWKSTDNGVSWNALITDLPTLAVSGIAIDHTNSNIVYCGTGDGDGNDAYSIGVLKSTDGGATWNPTGLNWSLTQTRTVRKVAMHPTDPNILFCAANNGLWKTTNGGVSWSMVHSEGFRDVEFKPGNPSVVYACGRQFLRSVDGGDNFTLVQTGLPALADVNRMAITVSADNDQMVYALCGRDDDGGFLGLYRSTDGGLTFTLRSDSPNIFTYSDQGSGSGGQSRYDMALVADPANDQVIYAAGINVWKSINGGTSWTIMSHWTWPSTIGYTHADVHCLEMAGTKLWCGSDGGVFLSTNAGADWTDLSDGLNIMQLYRLGGTEADAGLVVSGSQDNGSNTLEGGTWTHVQGGDGMEAAIDPTDPFIRYCASQNGNLYRTYDGTNYDGITWSIGEDGAWVTPYVIDPNDPERLILGLNNVWVSNDRGDSWNSVSSFGVNETIRTLAVAPSNSDHMVMWRSGALRRTATGGAPWTALTGLPDLQVTSVAFHPTNELVFYVALSGYMDGEKVYVTYDGGTNWTNISINLPNAPVNSIVYQDGLNGGLYVGTDMGVFYTDNTLGNWQPFSQGMPTAIVMELEIHQSTGKLRAATYGRGLWETPLFVPSTQPPVANFVHSNTNICAGEPVVFTDASLDAAPGWGWSFPGGTPPVSTAASPSVTYSTSGVYSVSLGVTNANGSDSYTTNITVTIMPNEIDIALTVDDYPQETAWTITDDNTGQVVAGEGPFVGVPDGSTVNSTVCLPPGCYTFTITDSYGDGMCCDNGNGSWSVSNTQLGNVGTGGSFTYEESAAFCVSLNVGVQETASTSLVVLPTGTSGVFEARYSGPAGIVRVMDALGHEVMAPRRTNDSMPMLLDLSAQAAGMYLVKVTSGSGSALSRVVR